MEFEQSKHVNIAYFFCEEERTFLNGLCEYLEGLRRDRLICELKAPLAGAPVQTGIEQRLEKAQVIILLLSSKFDTDPIYSSHELSEQIRIRADEGVHIWPVIVKPFLWERSVYYRYGAFFGGERGKAITDYSPQDIAYKLIAEKIDNEVTLMLADEWVREGDMYHHQGCWNEALTAYDNGLHYISDYPPALFGKWQIFRTQSEADENLDRQALEKKLVQDEVSQREEKGNVGPKRQWLSLLHSYYKGCVYLELSRWEEASVAFRKVYSQIATPMDRRQRKLCAQAYCGEGDSFLKHGYQVTAHVCETYYHRAFDAYNKACKIDPGDKVYLARIGEIYIARGKSSSSQEYFERALEIYQQIIANDPNHVQAYVGLGNSYYHAHRLQKAFDAYEQAVQRDPYEATAYGGKGLTLLAFRKPQEALLAFEEALKLEHNNGQYLYGKGQSLAALERHQEAYEVYETARQQGFHQAVSFLEHYAATLIALGDTELAAGQVAEAKTYYIKARTSYQQASGQTESYRTDIDYCYGKLFSANRDWEKALIWYNRVAFSSPRNPEVYLEMGKVFIELGNYQDAFVNFEKARSLCQQSETKIGMADIETAYGDAHLRIADLVDANDSYNARIKARSHYENANSIREHPRTYIGLGKTNAALHYHQEAIDAFDRALTLNPKLTVCNFLKGKSYYELGQPSLAHGLYRTAMRDGLNSAALQACLGDALLALKRYSEALSVFKNISEPISEKVAEIYCCKGIALHELDMYEDAVQSFKGAYKENSSVLLDVRYRKQLWALYWSLERKLYADPWDATAYKCKGDILMILEENISEAAEAYTRAIENGYISAYTYFQRGWAYEILHEYQQAFNDYSEALNMTPTYQYAQQAKIRVANRLAHTRPQYQRRSGLLDKVASWLLALAQPAS